MWILWILPFQYMFYNTDCLRPAYQRHTSISWHGDERIMGVTEGVMDDCNSAFPPSYLRSWNHFLSLSFFHFLMNITSFQQWYHIFLGHSLIRETSSYYLTRASSVSSSIRVLTSTMHTGDLPFTEWYSIHLATYLYSHDVIYTINSTTNT